MFKISEQITNNEIENIYEKNFEKIIYEFFNLESEWMFNAYNEFQDIEKYLILTHLIHKTFQTYNKHFYKVSFEKFYNNPHIEIEKISIIDLVKSLSITKETARRKLNELSKDGSALRNGMRDLADEIRDKLKIKGIEIEDTNNGTIWRKDS